MSPIFGDVAWERGEVTEVYDDKESEYRSSTIGRIDCDMRWWEEMKPNSGLERVYIFEKSELRTLVAVGELSSYRYFEYVSSSMNGKK
jgi:hypothetical protein